MRFFISGLALLLGFSGLGAAADSCIWFSHDDTIRHVQTDTNQVIGVVPLRNPHRLVMDAASCGVWTLDKHDRRLLRYSAEGVLEIDLRVESLDRRLDEVELLQLDPYDGSLWIADERRLVHVSSSGQLLAGTSAPGEVRRMRVALDQSLWVLGKRELWRFDAQGSLLASYALGRHLAADARHLAVDSMGGWIWLADERELARLNLARPDESPLRIRLKREINGLALDPFTGNVWVAHEEALLAYSRNGALIQSAELEGLRIRKAETLAFDPVSRSLWVGAEKSVSRFTDTGQFVIRFPARDGDEALGVPAFKLEPTLKLVRPPQGALSSSPKPAFTLSYGALCNSQSCEFSNEYLAGFSVTALLNKQPVGSSFVFDPATAEAAFTPSARLPEGTNSFSMQVKDRFGHLSNVIDTTFTVDTIAPAFGPITPPGGTVLPTPQVTLQGSISEPGTAVLLQNAHALNPQGPNPQIPQPPNFPFSWGLTLLPGNNPIQISAVDPAGNATSQLLTLAHQPAGLSVSVTQPADGASVADERILVSGAVTGPENTGVSVNGVAANVAEGRFYALVPLVLGGNKLTVTATAFDGTARSAGVAVIRNGTSPFQVLTSPATGIAPFSARFTISASSGVSVAKFEADFNGSGAVDYTASAAPATLDHGYSTPGVYLARFALTDEGGVVHTQTVPVIVQDGVVVDTFFRGLWGGFTDLLVRGDLAAAQKYMHEEAQRKYAPILNALAGRMPQIVASYSPLLRGEPAEGIAEYAIVRDIGGSKRVYFIYFLQGEAGNWLIDSM